MVLWSEARWLCQNLCFRPKENKISALQVQNITRNMIRNILLETRNTKANPKIVRLCVCVLLLFCVGLFVFVCGGGGVFLGGTEALLQCKISTKAKQFLIFRIVKTDYSRCLASSLVKLHKIFLQGLVWY